MRALFTLRRREHCRTIEGMECVCEHYSRCVGAHIAALLEAWNVCEHYSRCDIARTAALLRAWNVCAIIIHDEFHVASSRTPQHCCRGSANDRDEDEDGGAGTIICIKSHHVQHGLRGGRAAETGAGRLCSIKFTLGLLTCGRLKSDVCTKFALRILRM